jgi:hypothetical protein
MDPRFNGIASFTSFAVILEVRLTQMWGGFEGILQTEQTHTYISKAV